MLLTPVEKTLIKCFSDNLRFIDMRAHDEAMTRIGARVPGKHVNFFYDGKALEMEDIIHPLLLGEIIVFGPLMLQMTDDLNHVVATPIPHVTKSYRPDMVIGFKEVVMPQIESVCALVIQTVRNFENPLGYR